MNRNASASAESIGLTPELFAAAFPFHIVVDRQCNILGAGVTVARICPDLRPGATLPQILRLVRPEMEFTPENIERNRDRFFLLEHRATKIQLRGQFVLHPERDVFLFLGSPWFRSADELTTFQLGFEDFAIHDQVADSLQVFQASQLALADAKRLADKLTAQRTELRTANQRLQEQARQNRTLALIASRTTNAVVLTDALGRIEWANEGFTRITEYTLPEAVGKTPGSLLQGPETDPASVRFIREQLRKGEGFSVEIVNYSKSGRKYWLAIEVQPIRDEVGRVVNYMAIESDITERKESERAMRASETHLVNALQIARAGHWEYDVASDRFTFNDNFYRIFRTTAESVGGYRLSVQEYATRFLLPEDVALVAEETRKAVASATADYSRTIEHRFRYADGAIGHLAVRIKVMRDASGRVIKTYGVNQDITERKHDEEKLRASLSDLERFNRVMMNREERVIELKREINEMCLALGQPAAYPSVMEQSPK